MAIQSASDRVDEAEEELRAWDAQAPFNWREVQRRLVAEDRAGFAGRALAVLDRTERLAPTRAARAQLQWQRAVWKQAIRPFGRGSAGGPAARESP